MSASLLLTAIAALHLPVRPTLELHDVQDLTYDLDFPGVNISLSTGASLDPIIDVNLLMTGRDLAEQLQILVPGSPLNFQNGLLIVRATPVQHAAVRGALRGYRARNRTVVGMNDLLTPVFGMITK